MEKDKPDLKCTPDGPYQLNNCTLINSKGDILSDEKQVYLCRCGGSSNKPFCDGTHFKNGFSDKKITNGEWDKRDNYIGAEVTIHDNRGICAHSGVCTDNLSKVFKLGQEPWIDPDGASLKDIVATIKRCPSGALSYSIDCIEFQEESGKPRIVATKNGPYAASGGLKLQDIVKGEGAKEDHFTLCRCGGSKNKPFCDGTHWHNNFTDDKN